MRTTLDIDATVLARLRRLARARKTTMGAVASELLAVALADEPQREKARLEWVAAPMRSKVDLEDKDAVYAALDRV